MGILLGPDHPLRIEEEKWNKPWVFAPFPAMVYKARKLPNGKPSVGEANDGATGGAPGSAEVFTKTTQLTVKSEDELRRAKNDGWKETPLEALAYFERLEQEYGNQAAHRLHDDRNLGEKAKAKAEAVDAASFEHVAEIPADPVKRRGRKPGSKNKPKVELSN